MTVYDDGKAIAKEILADPEFRQDTVKLIQIVPGTGPADDPGASTETSYILDAVVKGPPYSFMKSGFVSVMDNLVVAAPIDGITPTINDFVEINNVRSKILADLSVPSVGTRVVWKLLVGQVRRNASLS